MHVGVAGSEGEKMMDAHEMLIRVVWALRINSSRILLQEVQYATHAGAT